MITLKRFEGQSITPSDDAILYDNIIRHNGILRGCELTCLGGNMIRIGEGRGIIKGRDFIINEETILATLSASGTRQGRLLIHVDLMDVQEPIKFQTQIGTNDTLPQLVKNEDINYEAGIYQLELATYTASEIMLTDFKRTVPDLKSWMQEFTELKEKVDNFIILAIEEEIIFDGLTATIPDSRITAASIPNIYFTADCIGAASAAEIVPDTFAGRLVLTAKAAPVGTITATIEVRII